MVNKIEISRKNLEEIYSILNKVKDGKYNPKFSYLVIRNINFLIQEYTTLHQLRQTLVPTEKLLEYNDKIMDISNQYGQRDIHGNFVTVSENVNGVVQNNIYFGSNKFLYEQEKEKIDEEYFEELKSYKEIEQEFLDVWNEEITLEVLKIPYKLIPEDVFSIEELFLIQKLIKETPEELDKLIIGED